MGVRVVRLLCILGLLLLPSCTSAETLTCASCSAADVNTKIGEASPGDTVVIPAGGVDPLCVWGTGTATVTVDKAITLQGSGTESTIITAGTGTALSIAASSAKVKNFKMQTDNDTASNAVFVSFAGDADKWVLLDMDLDQTTKKLGYVLGLTTQRASGTSDTYGVVARSSIMFDGEQINFRGPCDSWDTAHSLGGAENLFIEGCTLYKRTGGSTGYIDCNANSRAVFRWNNIDGVYIDTHGSWSNTAQCSPEYHESARHVEIYYNYFGATVTLHVYMRGGTGLVFGNTSAASAAWIYLDEYYVRSGRLTSQVIGTDSNSYMCKLNHTSADANKPITGGSWETYWELGQQGGWAGDVWESGRNYSVDTWPYYHNGCACDADYPVLYQIGRGLNTSSPPADGGDQASEPVYIWNNKRSGNDWSIDTSVYSDVPQKCKDYCGDAEMSCSDFIQADRDYVVSSDSMPEALSGYSVYGGNAPHPLTELTGICDPNVPGVSGYNLGESGATKTITFNGSRAATSNTGGSRTIEFTY